MRGFAPELEGVMRAPLLPQTLEEDAAGGPYVSTLCA